MTRLIGFLTAAVVLGTISDKTTTQPLVHVDVTASGAKSAHGRTDDRGRFTLRGLPPGSYSLVISSDDVPPQRFTISVGTAPTQHVDLTGCSTTLDYSCANAMIPGGG